MKRLACVLALGALGCASNSLLVDPSPFIRIMGFSSVGHGCPVGENLILTARHVIENKGDYQARWSDLQGTHGMVRVRSLGTFSDLALLETNVSVAVYYRIAETRPPAGMKVLIAGMDWRTAELKPTVMLTTVGSTSGGHVFYDASPGSGSSGGCVLGAEDGLVYAIQTGREAEHGWGQGVAVWGKWNPLLGHPLTLE